MIVRPLRPGERRAYRYIARMRFGSLLGFPLGSGLVWWLVQNADLFAEHRLLQIGLVLVAVMLIVAPLLLYSQVYVLADEGIISHDIFRETSVDWSAIEWVSLDRKPLVGRRYCIYTTSNRRWCYPKLAIPDWVGGFDELVTLIRDRVLSIKTTV